MKLSTQVNAQHVPPAAQSTDWPRRFTGIVLALAVVLVFWPVRNFEFVHYDDPEYITNNPHVRQGLTGSGVIWAFVSEYAANWHPTTWISHMLDVNLFGLSPRGPHLVNLVFHVANTSLLFLILQRITGAQWRSALVAALFALHPLHVESVAWVSERKDVLCAMFGLLTLWFYGRLVEDSQFQKATSRKFYWLAMLFFAFGLMSKPMLVTLPFVLLLLDYWPLRRIASAQPNSSSENLTVKALPNLLLEKIPLFILSAISGVITVCVQQKGGAIQAVTNFPIGARIENTFISYARYLGKTFWPVDLATPYPHPGHWPLGAVILGVVLVGLVSIVALRFARRWPFLVTGWFWFLGMLVPVIGLIQVGGQSMADRYTYLPLIGIFIMVSWGATELLTRLSVPRTAMAGVAALTLIACAARTSNQLSYWQNSEKLFRHAIAITKDNVAAYNGLGCYFDYLKRPEEALVNYREAVRIDPKDFLAWDNIGFYFFSKGRLAEAIENYHRALAANTNDPVTLNNLGTALLKQKQYDDAIGCYRAALRVRDDFPDAHINLGMALNAIGKTDEASVHYLEALRLMPDAAEAHNNLANIFFGNGRLDDAIAEYRQALKFKPDFEETLNNLGWALAAKGQFDDSIACYQHLLQLNPNHALGHSNLGKILAAVGRGDEAMAQFIEALRLDPNSAETHFAFSKILARAGRQEEAAAQLKEALRLDPRLAGPQP